MSNFLFVTVGIEDTELVLESTSCSKDIKPISKSVKISNQRHKSLEMMITDFLQGAKLVKAFIIVNRLPKCSSSLRSLPQFIETIDQQQLSNHFSHCSVEVLTYIESLGISLKRLNMSGLLELNKGIPNLKNSAAVFYFSDEPALCLSLDSGPLAGKDSLIVSDALDLGIGARSADEFELLIFFRKALQKSQLEEVRFSDVFSSKGICQLYNFASAIKGISSIEQVRSISDVIRTVRRAEKMEILKSFSEILLSLIGQLAYTVCVSFLCEGGFYVFGSEFCKLLQLLKDQGLLDLSTFEAGFFQHTALNESLRRFPVAVFINQPEPDIRATFNC